MITTRLQLASRIQLLLFRELGEKIAIDRLLASELYARDVLLVCEAMRNEELVDLAHRFRRASAAQGKPAREPELSDWSDDSSGLEMAALPPGDDADAPRGWLAATRRWLRL